MLTKLIAGGSALALCASPAMAAPTAVSAPKANPASSLSVVGAARASAPAQRTQRLGQPGSVIGLVLAAAVVAGGVYLVIDDDDEDADSD